jgi:hypothetical protein
MLFKNPNLLYALFALIIPIIVHLFQLRRFKKVPFTNVAMLQKLELQTRKSAILKKWLVLLARLGLFALLIFAFSKPYFPSASNQEEQHQETLIYLDNSFSMQAQGKQGALFKNSVQKLLENIENEAEFSLLTNDNYYPKQKGSTLKKIIQNIDYSPQAFDFKRVLLRGNQYLNKQQAGIHNFILISDFQKEESDSLTGFDSKTHYLLLQKKAENKANTSVEKVTIKALNQNSYTLIVQIKNQSDNNQNSTVSLFSNEKLLAKNTLIVPANTSAKLTFSIDKQESISGKISIQDQGLAFDNAYYFSINSPKKLQILLIGTNTDYLQRIYTTDKFNTKTVAFNAIDYSSFSKQDLIVINELVSLSNLFKNNLQDYIKNGGNVLIIPSKSLEINNALTALIGKTKSKNDSLFITKINYEHRILKDVFKKQVNNFDYPFSTYSFSTNTKNSILNFANGASFISEKQFGLGKIYFVASSLDKQSSDFKNSPLIVPIFYNIASYNTKTNITDLIIGKENNIDIPIKINKDAVLSLTNETMSFIPQQQVANNKVRLITEEKPNKSGIYAVKFNNQTIQDLAFNYNRIENSSTYYNLSKLESEHIKLIQSFEQGYEQLKQNTQITTLWKWFIMLAIAFILLEIIFLKYLK